ncbi:ribonuclease J, partial [Candidatus Microgenomates bacterium]|nr:ribonuclease J [Candidatus Microgenomates bacterium]
DTVVYSSDPAPPGSKESVDSVVDQMIQSGVDVYYYDIQENLHVSGHGSKQDIQMLMSIVKPKYFIPIGGTVRHNRAYANIAYQMGAPKGNVYELDAGQIVEFSNKQARIFGKIQVKQVLVDGLGVGDVGSVVLRDRQVLAKDGILIVLLEFDKTGRVLVENPELISRGFVFAEKSTDLLTEAALKLKRFLDKKKIVDSRMVKAETANFLERYFWEEMKRRPMILPVVVEV